MKTVLVASSKGGVGKTTIATHLAAQAAVAGRRTALVDADPQGSATRWCERRADLASAVLPVAGLGRKGWRRDLPDDTERVVIDARAGAMADDLEAFLERADAVVVPILPSMLDLEASVGFLDTLAKHPRVRRRELPVGLVGNKLRPWTNASKQSMDFLQQWPYPLVAQLRDSQAYSILVGLGRSLFDYNSIKVREHQDDWAPLLKWLQRAG